MIIQRALPLLLLAVCSPAIGAPIVWGGPSLEFSKAAFANSSLEANQDRMTDSVWLTRNDTMGFYNAASETFATRSISPEGTRWAVGTTADLENLTFGTWISQVDLDTPIAGPHNAVGVDFVVHLVAEDIYLDLRVTEWGQRSEAGGSFSYVRSTPGVPEPSTLLLLALGLTPAAIRRTR